MLNLRVRAQINAYSEMEVNASCVVKLFPRRTKNRKEKVLTTYGVAFHKHVDIACTAT